MTIRSFVPRSPTPLTPLIAHPVGRYRLADVVTGLSAPAPVAEQLERLLATRLFYAEPLACDDVRRLVGIVSSSIERVNAGSFTVTEALARITLTHAALVQGVYRRRALRVYVRLLTPAVSRRDAFALVHALARSQSIRAVPLPLHRLLRSLAVDARRPTNGLVIGLTWLTGAMAHRSSAMGGLYSTARDDYATQTELVRQLQLLVAREGLGVTIDVAFLTALPLVPVWLTVPAVTRPVPAFCLTPAVRRLLTNGRPLGILYDVLDAVERPVGLTPACARQRHEVANVAVLLPCGLTRQVADALEHAFERIRTLTDRNPAMTSFFHLRQDDLTLGLFLPLAYVALAAPVWVDCLVAADALCRPSANSALPPNDAALVTRRLPGTGEAVTGVVLKSAQAGNGMDKASLARERAAWRSLEADLALEALSARHRQDDARDRRREKLPETLLRPALTPSALAALARALPEPDCAWLASLTLVELAHHTLRLRRQQTATKGLP
ncbi:MAG: hypothetical protein J6S08_03570 [Duodenibacillus sp.]|nr:hypothetical protein [Duodenibacillus sp.]